MTCRKEFEKYRYCRLVRPQVLLGNSLGGSAAAVKDPSQKYTTAGISNNVPPLKKLRVAETGSGNSTTKNQVFCSKC
jgi:hypothetical protein